MKIALLAVLFAALARAQTPPEALVSPQLLLEVPIGADPEKVMELTRDAFAGRKWAVGRDADGAVLARNRGPDVDATLKVFLAGGALRFIDGSVDRKGARAPAPERWLNYIRADLRRSIGSLGRTEDAATRLRRLKALLDQGLISQTEYDAKRAEILKGL